MFFACGNSVLTFVSCFVPRSWVIISQYLLWHYRGGVSFLMQQQCCGLLWLAIYCFVCRSLCLILQEVQVSLLQIPLYQIEDFSGTSLAFKQAHSFPLFFFICLLVVFSLCKKTGTFGKKKKRIGFYRNFWETQVFIFQSSIA